MYQKDGVLLFDITDLFCQKVILISFDFPVAYMVFPLEIVLWSWGDRNLNQPVPDMQFNILNIAIKVTK